MCFGPKGKEASQALQAATASAGKSFQMSEMKSCERIALISRCICFSMKFQLMPKAISLGFFVSVCVCI